MVRKQTDTTSKNLKGAGMFNKMKFWKKNKQPYTPLEKPSTTSVPPSTSRIERLKARRIQPQIGYQQIPNQNSNKKYNYMII